MNFTIALGLPVYSSPGILADMMKKKMRLRIFSLPLVFGLVNAPHIHAQSAQATAASLPSFEVASIKPSRPGGGNFGGSDPDRLHVTDVTTKWLIEYAYNDFHAGPILRDDQLLGAHAGSIPKNTM
jgi:hypothetical protein